jgi:hypothetical protein
VSFVEPRSYQFQPDRSRGSESDYITLPNILVLVSCPPPCFLVPLCLPGMSLGFWVAPETSSRDALGSPHVGVEAGRVPNSVQ